jgi:hypothetical protein
MRKIALLSVCALLTALVASFVSSARANDPDPGGGGSGCIKFVHVTFQVATGGMELNPAQYGTGCWDANQPYQNQGSWWLCKWTGDWPDGNFYGPNWLYDETSYTHGDQSTVDDCARDLQGLGYEDMAYSGDYYPHWQQVYPSSAPTPIFFAETYTDQRFQDWLADETWVGRPMPTVGNLEYWDAYFAVYNVCRAIGPGTRMGIWSADGDGLWTNPDRGGGKLTYVVSALNQCTRG